MPAHDPVQQTASKPQPQVWDIQRTNWRKADKPRHLYRLEHRLYYPHKVKSLILVFNDMDDLQYGHSINYYRSSAVVGLFLYIPNPISFVMYHHKSLQPA